MSLLSTTIFYTIHNCKLIRLEYFTFYLKGEKKKLMKIAKKKFRKIKQWIGVSIYIYIYIHIYTYIYNSCE